MNLGTRNKILSDLAALYTMKTKAAKTELLLFLSKKPFCDIGLHELT